MAIRPAQVLRSTAGVSFALTVFLLLPPNSIANDPPEQALPAEEVEYRAAIHQRSERIVSQLELSDANQAARVTRLVAEQYRNLRDLHASRDARLAALEGNQAGEPNGDWERQKVAAKVDRDTLTLHRKFVAQLAAELPADQVERIKDGMTYGVVNITYNAYLELLPDLSDEQKRVIKANLIEAREYAMDAGSSDKKHAWFGKYKGRINNFLSAAGYDLKQAEGDLARRRQEAQSAESSNSESDST